MAEVDTNPFDDNENTAQENDSPWDMSPASQAQLDYMKEQIRRIAAADLTKLDTTVASNAITHLNSVRRSLGITYEAF